MPMKPASFRPHSQTRKQVEQSWASRRDGRHAMYNMPAWRGKPNGIRAQCLTRDPFCVECDKEGKQTRATEVDHIVPHKGDMQLFLDINNVQSLCKTHHSQKTKRENQ